MAEVEWKVEYTIKLTALEADNLISVLVKAQKCPGGLTIRQTGLVESLLRGLDPERSR